MTSRGLWCRRSILVGFSLGETSSAAQLAERRGLDHMNGILIVLLRHQHRC